MSRQVRLDDDVADIVEALSEGMSLSATTNRLLREAHAEASVAELAAPEGIVAPPAALGPVRPAVARRARRFAGSCPHPLSRRVGERCAACGRVVH